MPYKKLDTGFHRQASKILTKAYLYGISLLIISVVKMFALMI
jgi:hypothetical protein